VSSTSDAPFPSSAPDRSSVDERSFPVFRAAIAEALRSQRTELTARWITQSRAVTLLELPETGPDDSFGSAAAEEMVDALIAVLCTDEDAAEAVVSRGMSFGADAFARSASLHHTMKALDLLLAMTMYAAESAAAGAAAQGASAVDALRLARQLQQRAAVLSLAATRGYTQAYADALRERFRHLRHDLRNPLGTIKSVLSLLDDESIPFEARANPSFRAMAKRNARSLEDLIADRLSDAAALLPVLAPQDVSLRSIACGVRRELRVPIERHGATVLVGEMGPHGLVDATGLELLLRDVLLGALGECRAGDQFRLEFAEGSNGRATVDLSLESGRAPITDATVTKRLSAMAARISASVDAGSSVIISVPIRSAAVDPPPAKAAERATDRAIVVETSALGDGEPRHDVRGASEREHGETGTL
jgi:signal transduction histidine kinase